jgi:hypothetical protein
MDSLEETMKNQTINIDSSFSNSSSHGHTLFASIFSFNATSTSYNKWFIDFRTSYHMAKDKEKFSSIN